MSPIGPVCGVAGDREAGTTCPCCAAVIQSGDPVAVCRSCGAILDREKAAQYGLVAKEDKLSAEPRKEKESGK